MGRLRPVGLRKVSEVEGFPYRANLMSYILVSDDGSVTNPRLVGERANAIRAVQDGKAQMFIVWPGDYRSDLFEVDSVDGLLAAYKLD